MKLLWVKSKLPLSKLITWGLNEPVSHFIICFDDKIVFHSNFTGMHIAWFQTILKSYTVVYEIDIPMSLEDEEALYQGIITKYDGSCYDYGAFAYFAWRAALKKFFGKPIPETNPWGDKDKFLCDEAIQLLPDSIVGAEIKKMDFAMQSPFQVIKSVLKSKPELRNHLRALDQESLDLLL